VPSTFDYIVDQSCVAGEAKTRDSCWPPTYGKFSNSSAQRHEDA